MQNWALQQVLKRLGHEPETITLNGDKRPSGVMLAMRCASLVKCIMKRYLLNRKDVYFYSIFNPRYCPSAPQYADSAFVNGINKTKSITADIDWYKFLSQRRYDAFVVGSDQVWREDYSPNITSYFLDFLPKDDKRKRIAYATSFGKRNGYICEEKMLECRRLLDLFDAVSVRENEGVGIVKNDFGRDQVEKVLDPTLLLSTKDYEELIQPKDRHHKPYIASYILDNSDEKSTILKQIAESKNLPVNEVDIEVKPEGMPTVSQWLANFADSDFVVTDSFHGCVFSIIYGKPFIAIANPERGLDRFKSLLGEFGLNDRLIFNVDNFEEKKNQLMNTPDYESSYRKLKKLRQSSLEFLTDALA